MSDEKVFYKNGDDYFNEGVKAANKILSNELIKKSIPSYVSNFKKIANIIIENFNKDEKRNIIEYKIARSINDEFNIFLNNEQLNIIKKELSKIKQIKKPKVIIEEKTEKKVIPKLNIKDDISLC